ATTSPSLSLASRRTYFANLPAMEVRSVTTKPSERDRIVEIFIQRHLFFILARGNRLDLDVFLRLAVLVRVSADRQFDRVTDPIRILEPIRASQYAGDVIPCHHLVAALEAEDGRIQLFTDVDIDDLLVPIATVQVIGSQKTHRILSHICH